MKLSTNSNIYTIVYASVMVIVVAFCLACVSELLRPRQEANVANDKRSQILAALNIRNVENVQEEYGRVLLRDMIIDINGNVLQENGGVDVESKQILAKDDAAKRLPVYVCKVESDTLYVLPLFGRGLWGELWGYLALKDDFRTVYGMFMSHASETAGLGARITEEQFQNKFIGKQTFGDGDFSTVLLGVKKKVEAPGSEVDAITGATLTSNGVDEMFKTSLAPYRKFFETSVAPAISLN